MKSKLLWSIGSVLALLVAAELGARWLLGLGSPVLYVADPQVEYMLRPNQDVMRFGNRIVVNDYGMRSEPFPKHKGSDDELRVMVLGDSVVNGGNRIDQQRLATTLLRDRLRQTSGRPVVVGNISAGSWGPPNQLAWTQQFGFMDADMVVVVLSSHDASDVPTFAPLNPSTHPTLKPVSALLEGATHYLSMSRADASAPELFPETRAVDPIALRAFIDLVEQARKAGACVALVQHATQKELDSEPGPGHSALQSIASELGIAHLDDATSLAEARQRGTGPFQDNIHLNDAGQAILAQLLTQAVAQCKRTAT